MPVHWFYNPDDILKTFSGGITKFEDCPVWHPHQFMKLEGPTKEVIGKVILKDKVNGWDGVSHVHTGMKAGDNTLNTYCAQLLFRQLVENKEYSKEKFLVAYRDYLTAEKTAFPDTYAEGFHRTFFLNFAQGKPLEQCGEETGGTASIGGLVMIGPLILFEYYKNQQNPKKLEVITEIVKTQLYLTHPSESLWKVCQDYVRLLVQLLDLSSEAD